MGENRIVICRWCICLRDLWIKTGVCGGDYQVESVVARNLSRKADMLSEIGIRQEGEMHWYESPMDHLCEY